MGTVHALPTGRARLVREMVTGIQNGRATHEIRRLALQATASLPPRRASQLIDILNAFLRLIDEAPEKGWPLELLKQNAVDSVWDIGRAVQE